MLVSNTVLVKWNSKTKKHYQDKGYIYTKIGDTFDCKPEDLTNGSNVEVNVQCDYCGREYTIQWYIRYNKVINGVIHKDACKFCCELKSKEVLECKYGTSILNDIAGVVEKRIQTNIDKYGYENPFSNESVKEKIRNTNIQKYGETNPSKNNDVQNKIRETNLERYNCECVFQCDKVKEQIKETCLEKYGYDNYMKYAKEHQLFVKENSPHWSGGDCNNHRWNFKYVDWRNQVLKRDNYYCRCCNQRQSLEVHHIENWSTNIDKRYDVDNGITLCKECHIKFHKKYTKYNNNYEQIIEFCSQTG